MESTGLRGISKTQPAGLEAVEDRVSNFVRHNVQRSACEHRIGRAARRKVEKLERFLTAAARLMGVPDNYKLPNNYNEAYHLMGDGLAVPVISWLEKHILTPLVHANKSAQEAA